MDDPNVDFRSFLPEPWAPESGVSSVISSTCIWVILALGVGAFGLQLFRFLRARRCVQLGLANLNKVTHDTFAEQRRQLDDEMGKVSDLGELWHEFDETLVSSRDGKRVYNTLDADHFFNSSTLGAGVTENRFIAAVPGMLTALGVFGTFIGLQLGLASLDLSDADTMTKSMTPLIAGAAIAFKTSVWGILASLVFNVAEKVIEGRLLSSIRRLQLFIDRLLDRSLGEQALVEIQGHAQESEKLLRVLGEQIGDKIQEGISSAIAPQLEKLSNLMSDLADRQASGAEDALRSLVEEFTGKVGEAGEKQAEQMSAAAESLADAMNRLDSTIDSFLKEVSSQIDELSKVNLSNQALSQKVQEKAQEVIAQAEVGHKEFADVSASVSEAADTLLDGVERLREVQSKLETTISEFGTNQNKASSSFLAATQSLRNTSQSLDSLKSSIGETAESIEGAARGLEQASESVSETFASLPEAQHAFLENLKQGLEESVTAYTKKVAESVTDFAEQLQGSTNTRVDEWTNHTSLFCNNMKDAVDELSRTIDEIRARGKSSRTD